jgi:hypothetical protein
VWELIFVLKLSVINFFSSLDKIMNQLPDGSPACKKRRSDSGGTLDESSTVVSSVAIMPANSNVQTRPISLTISNGE